MKLKLEFEIPEEQGMAEQYYHAPVAWSAIDDALNKIRSYIKHDVGTAEQCIQDVRFVLSDVRSKIE